VISPDFRVARKSVEIAAMPVAKQTAGGVSSRAPSAASSAETVGFAARE
jgi:hypothetical protein